MSLSRVLAEGISLIPMGLAQGPALAAEIAISQAQIEGLKIELREVRACLEANKDKVAAACKAALATTGGGR